MKKSYIISGVVAVVVIAILGFVFLGNQSGSQYTAPTPQTPTAPTPTPIAPPQPPSNPITSSSATVTYTDSGFSPATIPIKKGDTVIFKNTASDDMRVSSNPHPIHNGYPTTGGCVGSTFDSCSTIHPGSSWSFTFTFVGKWGYHNHLNPSEGGTVIVQ